MERLLATLRRDGSGGVHLGVAAGNVRAIGFYQHLGFTPLIEDREARVLWMGHPLR
jgi:ribosomal protein S18 acetylase RimI-like enzyme